MDERLVRVHDAVAENVISLAFFWVVLREEWVGLRGCRGKQPIATGVVLELLSAWSVNKWGNMIRKGASGQSIADVHHTREHILSVLCDILCRWISVDLRIEWLSRLVSDDVVRSVSSMICHSCLVVPSVVRWWVEGRTVTRYQMALMLMPQHMFKASVHGRLDMLLIRINR